MQSRPQAASARPPRLHRCERLGTPQPRGGSDLVSDSINKERYRRLLGPITAQTPLRRGARRKKPGRRSDPDRQPGREPDPPDRGLTELAVLRSLRAGQRAAAVMSLSQSAWTNRGDFYAYLRKYSAACRHDPSFPSWRGVFVFLRSLLRTCQAAVRRRKRYRRPSRTIPASSENRRIRSGRAGVVQWQNGSFPSCIRGFDSLHPLQTTPGSLCFIERPCLPGSPVPWSHAEAALAGAPA
jgi:hypothetical protein